MKKEIKEKLTTRQREKIIEQLIEDYIYYINDSDNEELQKIYNSGCFTVGSMNYYKQLDKETRRK